MESLIILGKSATILSLFYGVYFFFLRGNTLFTAKRYFFVAGITCAVILPFVSFQKTIYKDPAPIDTTSFSLESLLQQPVSPTTIEEAPETTIDVWQILLLIYLIGVVLLTFRFIFQAFSLYLLLQKHTSKTINGYRYIEVRDTISPFSVFKYIVYNPTLHTTKDLQMILKHEETHAKQWHSMDTFLSQLLCILQWVNPFSWAYKKAMIANLEFIADQNTVTQLTSKKQYQLTLVKASSPIIAPALASPFYESLIKKRIIMLNKRTSNKRNLIKMSIVLPLLAVFMLSFNVTENYVYLTDTNSETSLQPEFTIQPNTTEKELLIIVNTINAATNNFKVDFQQIQRDDATNNLTKLVIATKFDSQNRFVENITYGGEDKNISTIKMRVIDNELELRDLENKMELRITPKGVVVYTFPKKQKKEENSMKLGENPLYIINNKEYRKKDLPKDAVLTNDGEIIVLNQKEGKAQYGAKGGDGVLVFNGNTTMAQKLPQQEDTPAKLKKSVTNDFEFEINKNTTDVQLNTIKQKLKGEGAVFDYDVTRNRNGEITGISFSYSDDKGNKTSYKTNNNIPITTIYFYRNEYGIGVGNPGDQEGIKKMMAQQKEALAERQNAMEEQKEAMEQQQEAMEEKKEAISQQKNAIKIQQGKVEEQKKAIKEHSKTLTTVSTLKDINLIEGVDGTEPIYVINGKVALKEDLKNLNPNQIQSINILKGKDANKWFGEKGENGVIQITIKSHTTAALSDIYITKNTTDTELNDLELKLKQLGYEVSYKRKKRNDTGQLTSLKVQVKGNGLNKVAFAKKNNDAPIDDMRISF